MANRVYHWKHGWIPLDQYAALKKAHGDRDLLMRQAAQRAGTPAVGQKLLDSIEANGGFSYDAATGRLLEVGKDKGFAVAVPGSETIIGFGKGAMTRESFARGVKSVALGYGKQLTDGKHVLGGWYSPERNAYMVELTEIVPAGDREKAIHLGTIRNQEAIFDLSTGETIPTGGTGGG